MDGKPSNRDTGYIVMGAEGLWNEMPANNKYSYICQSGTKFKGIKKFSSCQCTMLAKKRDIWLEGSK